MAKRTVIAAKPPPPKLIVSREEAKEKLTKQLERGKEIQNIQINSKESLDSAWSTEKKWIDYVSEMLQRFFDNESVKEDFMYTHGSMRMAMNFYEQLENFNNDLNAKITELESIIERLELIPESIPSTNTVNNVNEVATNVRDIFIVHGYDENMKTSVARFIQSIGLNPIILHEQPNGGRTIIEKLEHYSGVGFAVVIMTPDDRGYPSGEEDKIKPRARQNVLVELGFFVGKLLRKNVCVLYYPGVEQPSDFLGVVYIPLDSGEGWKLPLAREIKNAGIPVNLNNII